MNVNYGQIQAVYLLMGELEKKVSKKSWEKAYSYRIRKFFEEYLSQEEHKNRSLMDITANEVNNFLESLPYKHNEKVNYYSALKLFFDFAAKKGAAQPFYIKVNKLVQERGKPEYITDAHVKKLISLLSITNEQGDEIENKLLIALFLYTGLGRKYISELSYDQISDDMSRFRLNGLKYEIPIKEELHKLLLAYKMFRKPDRRQRIFDIDETSLTYRVKSMSKTVCGKSYTPTQFSNTFIKKVLGEKDPWKNLYTVSQLTNESLMTIAKHINVRPSWMFSEQQTILKQWE